MNKMKKYISNIFFIFFITFSQSLAANQVKYSVNFPFSVGELHLDFKDLDVDVHIKKMSVFKKDDQGFDTPLRITIELDEIYPINIDSDSFITTEERGLGSSVFYSSFSGLSSQCVNAEKVVHVFIKAPEDLLSTIYAKRARVSSVNMKHFPRVFAHEDSFISSADTKNAVGVFQSTQHIDLYDVLDKFLKKKKIPSHRIEKVLSLLVEDFMFSLDEIMYKSFHMMDSIATFLAKKSAPVGILQKKISELTERIRSMWEYLHEKALKSAIEKSAKKPIRQNMTISTVAAPPYIEEKISRRRTTSFEEGGLRENARS